MKEQLHTYLNRYSTFSTEEMDRFYTFLTVKTFKKKEFILKEGSVCNFKCFIIKGLIRSFSIDEKGNENIRHFGIENWWFTDMESLTLKQPSLLHIQALEDTTLLFITRDDLERAYLEIPKLERIFRIITENMLIAIERKHEFYNKLIGKMRYDVFSSQLKAFSQRVPQYMIASYLGITPEYLSELRKKNIS